MDVADIFVAIAAGYDATLEIDINPARYRCVRGKGQGIGSPRTANDGFLLENRPTATTVEGIAGRIRSGGNKDDARAAAQRVTALGGADQTLDILRIDKSIGIDATRIDQA